MLPCSRTSPGYRGEAALAGARVRCLCEAGARGGGTHCLCLAAAQLGADPSLSPPPLRKAAERGRQSSVVGINALQDLMKRCQGLGTRRGGAGQSPELEMCRAFRAGGKKELSELQHSKELVQGSLLCREAQALVPKPIPSTSPEPGCPWLAAGRPAGLCSRVGALFPMGCAGAGSCRDFRHFPHASAVPSSS